MRLLRKINYGEFSEFIQEKKVHIVLPSSSYRYSNEFLISKEKKWYFSDDRRDF